MASANLTANPIRSLLSVLGIVIGIAAVIAILALGTGMRQSLLSQMTPKGVIKLNIYPMYDRQTNRIGQFDLESVHRLSMVPGVISVAPSISLMKQIRSRQATVSVQVNGVDENYLKTWHYKLVHGRNFFPMELEQRAHLLLINTEAARLLFPDGQAVGQMVYIGQDPWEVVGVYAPEDQALNLSPEMAAPLQTLARASDLTVNTVVVQMKSESMDDASAELLSVLDGNDPARQGLFNVLDESQAMHEMLKAESSFTLLGFLIGSISLLVGGIGMMNVMLTTVAERTREIGIRRAVGARRKDILLQFLTESCLLSAAGGLIGLVFGSALARFVPVFFHNFFPNPPEITLPLLFVSVGSGVLLGIAFGFYPAVKASRLSPAEALRSE